MVKWGHVIFLKVKNLTVKTTSDMTWPPPWHGGAGVGAREWPGAETLKANIFLIQTLNCTKLLGLGHKSSVVCVVKISDPYSKV